MKEMPLVHEQDDGIRPAGPPNECFYCYRKVGEPHKGECVAVHKKVKVKYIFEIEIEVPHFWNRGNIEFHRNEGSWCADNAIDDIQEYMKKQNEQEGCLCNDFKCKYIQEADTTPYIKVKTPEEVERSNEIRRRFL